MRLALLGLLLVQVRAAESPWTQWGGPSRNFSLTDVAIAVSSDAPRSLWERELGTDGFSGIAAEGNRIFTGFRKGAKEGVVALAAATGEVAWTFEMDSAFDAPPPERNERKGPHVMPQIAGDRVFFAGVNGALVALDKKSGRQIWRRDLYTTFGGAALPYGYSSHPLLFENRILAMVGGTDKAVASFDQRDGKLQWVKHTGVAWYGSPLLIRVDGQAQAIVPMQDELMAIEPRSGEKLWSIAHPKDVSQAVSLPVWTGELLIQPFNWAGGTRALRLRQSGGKTTVETAWESKRFRVQFSTMTADREHLYASSGYGDGATPFTAVRIRDGEVAWQERAFSRAFFVQSGDKVVVLDQTGLLAIATVAPSGITVHSKTQVLDREAYTAPTVYGGRIFVRDQKRILAFEVPR